MQDLTHKILLILTAITIIGEVASIIFWTLNPTIPLGQARSVLVVDYRIPVASAAVFAALNLVAFVVIRRRNKNGPLLLIATSIVNRAISYTFFKGGDHLLFISWTAILVVFAYLDYRKLTKQQ